jgi:hypothetical protein
MGTTLSLEIDPRILSLADHLEVICSSLWRRYAPGVPVSR